MTTSFQEIKKQVCEEFNISVKDFNGKSRIRIVAAARRLAWWRAYHSLHLSLDQIGRMSGNRHLTTVWYGIKLQDHIFKGKKFTVSIVNNKRSKECYRIKKMRGEI